VVGWTGRGKFLLHFRDEPPPKQISTSFYVITVGRSGKGEQEGNGGNRMNSEAVSENERLLREAEERLRQKRAALGIGANTTLLREQGLPNLSVNILEQAASSKAGEARSGESHFTQDMQDSNDLLDAQDSNRHAVEAAAAACPGGVEEALLEGRESHFTQDMQDSNDLLDAQDSNRHAAEAAAAACPRGVEENADSDEAAVPDLSLPLDLYVEEAGRAEVAWMDQQTYEDTGNVEWKAGWHFVRLLKCHPELRDLKTLDALSKARAAVVRASQRLPLYRTLPGAAFNEVIGRFLEDTIDEFDAHFVRNWKAVRHLPGESPLETACHLANRHPLATDTAKGDVLPQYRKLVSLAGWLQYVVGDRNIFLPVHKLGPLIGCSARSVSTYIHMAEEEGILDRVESHSLKSRKAHEFRFRTDGWRILSEGPP
jgi:hypothetical protein